MSDHDLANGFGAIVSNSNSNNNSSSSSSIELQYPLPVATAIAICIGSMWALVVFGNLLVIVAIATDKKVNGVQNWFLASLAFADLLLGLLVLPFSLANQLLGAWVFGEKWCELWLAIDVLMCTASIMNLCLISLDRYWCVSQALTYPRQRTGRRAAVMIAIVWLLSAVICLPPLLGWRKPQQNERRCELTTDIGYVLYSCIGSFYIPMLIMIVVYARIFVAARRRARRSRQRCISSQQMTALHLSAHTLSPAKQQQQQQQQEAAGMSHKESDENSCEHSPAIAEGEVSKAMRKKRKFAKARERRATFVLGLIMGSFIACWLPFFTTYLTDIFCNCVPLLLFDFFFWLGYCNSALNPIIYTVFNRELRAAFRRVLSCRNRTCCDRFY